MLCLSSRQPIGKVEEVFGQVQPAFVAAPQTIVSVSQLLSLTAVNHPWLEISEFCLPMFSMHAATEILAESI